MQEAISNGENLRDVLDQFLNDGAGLPGLVEGAAITLLGCYLVSREQGIRITSNDSSLQSFFEGTRARISFEFALAFYKNDTDKVVYQLHGFADAVAAFRESGHSFSFPVQPQTKATQEIHIHNQVIPAPVTVNNAFASKAIQTVERDARDEIVATVTTYLNE